jgi:predicted N-acyltransferase
MTRLCIDYASFDDYMNRALNSATRKKLRKKFQATEQAPPIQMSIVDDVMSVITQVYPLYLQVYQRSKLHFEKLTEEYFCELGHRMRDKVRFFLWRQRGRIVAFATPLPLCLPRHGQLGDRQRLQMVPQQWSQL